MKLPPFDYACPATIPEAVQLLASHGDAKAIAGGQSLMPMLAFRLAHPTLLVDLRKLAELRGIRISERGVVLGAMVRWRDILDDARLATAHPLLKAAVAHVAHYQIRNRGTVGGSIAHADPAAELPALRKQYLTSSTMHRSDGVHLRIVADEAPGSGAAPQPPTLEDALTQDQE
jgi:carbon-monoxide dehydrogenase medium subunit